MYNQYLIEEAKRKIKKITHSNNQVAPILAMFGYKIKIDENDVNLYNLENILIGTMFLSMNSDGRTQLSINTKKGVLNIFYVTPNRLGDYTCKIELSSFNAIVGMPEYEEEKYISIELSYNKNDIPIEIDINISDPKEENKCTRFQATSYLFEAVWDNSIGSFGNYIDGTRRMVKYCDFSKCSYHNRILFMSEESILNKGNKKIIVSRDDDNQCRVCAGENIDEFITRSTLYIDRDLTLEEAKQYSLELLTTSRVKDFVYYILDSIDKNIPGMKKYIMNDLPFMKEVMSIIDNSNNQIRQSDETKNIINACSLEKCNIPISGSSNKIKVLK